MPDAVDFSQSHPSVAELEAAGVLAVIVKINGPNAITSAEIAAYIDAGRPVVFYYEVTAEDAQGGWAAGAQAAEAAGAIMVDLMGQAVAEAQPVYFAADQNIVVGTLGADPAPAGYFVGLIAGGRSRAINGVYGNGSFLDWLGASGLAAFFWQSSSSSFEGNGSTIAGAHIRQLATPSAIPGTDNDQLLQGDFGQYPRPA